MERRSREGSYVPDDDDGGGDDGDGNDDVGAEWNGPQRVQQAPITASVSSSADQLP